MKKLVAWKEEPVMEAPFENEESEVTVSMNHEETHADEDEKDEPETLPVKRPSKKELDREETVSGRPFLFEERQTAIHRHGSRADKCIRRLDGD